MDRRVYRIYFDYEKEERWLNEMASYGWMMKSFFLGLYQFQKGEPGEYIYRIELLPRRAQAVESQAYLQFMEESGIEVVTTWVRWAYYRRKASEGAFDLYSDIASRLSLYKRVLMLFTPLCIMYWTVALINIISVVHSLITNTTGSFLLTNNVMIAVIYCICGIGFTTAVLAAYKPYKRLVKEQRLRE